MNSSNDQAKEEAKEGQGPACGYGQEAQAKRGVSDGINIPY